MKIVSAEIVDGKEILKEKPFVLREGLTNLLNMETNEHRLTPEKKSRAYQIMKKLWDHDEVDLTVEQRAYIIERAKDFYPPMTCGVLEDLLEGKKKEKS